METETSLIPIFSLQEEEALYQAEKSHHALLIHGPKHIGKTRFILSHLAKKLSTAEHNLLTHPDIVVIDMLYQKDSITHMESIAKHTNLTQEHRIKNETKTNTITIEDIRALHSRVSKTPSTKKIYVVITNIERLNTEAGNHFLKLLEEPPSYVQFYLTTSNLYTVLATLLSRTVSFQAKPTSRTVTQSLFPEVKEWIHILCNGRVGLLKQLINDDEKLEIFTNIKNSIEEIVSIKNQKSAYILSENITSNESFFNTVLEELPWYLEGKKMYEFLPSSLEALQLRKKNIHPKLILEHLFLSIEKHNIYPRK